MFGKWSRVTAKFQITLLSVGAGLLVGCGESAEELRSKKLNAERHALDDSRIKRESKHREVEAETDKVLAESREHVRTTKRMLHSATLDSLSSRSTYEAAVSDAISMLDKFKSVDHATGQLMENSREWYSLYRDCESTNSPGSNSHKDAVLMPIHDNTVHEFMDADEQLAAVHALVDVRTLIRGSHSAKDRATALSELCRYFRRVVLIVHGLDGRVADADAIKNGADALKDFDEGIQIVFPGLKSRDMIQPFFQDSVKNGLDKELDLPLAHVLQAIELREKLMSAGTQSDR